LLDRRVSIGPAYPLPRDLSAEQASAQLATLDLLPMPLYLQRPKPTAGKQRKDPWPHWADVTGQPALRDCLQQPPAPGEAMKRSKDGDYLYRPAPDQAWRHYRQPTELRMHNSRGHWSQPRTQDQTDLFSTEYLPAGTLFMTEWRADPNRLQELLSELDGLPAGSLLRVGRGGAPLQLIHSAAGKATNSGSDRSGGGPLTLLLETDLIARTPELSFHSELNLTTLQQLLGLAELPAGASRHIGDSERQVGFNAASGLPLAPQYCIRRGSSLRIEGQAGDALRTALAARDSLGERRWEGHGRFHIDPGDRLAIEPGTIQDIEPANSDSESKTDSHLAQHGTRQTISRREAVLAQACAYQNKATHISRSQWNKLRDELEALPRPCNEATLQQALQRFEESVSARRGGKAWAPLFSGDDPLPGRLIDISCEHDHCNIDHARLFLRVMLSHATPNETPEETRGDRQ
jgi:hypothetical protein